MLKGAEVGLDIADGAIASMAGLTSQPSLNAIVESLRFTPRDTGVDHQALDRDQPILGGGARALCAVRVGPAIAGGRPLRAEMPGGQYTNLFQQAKALGLAARWHEVCKAYSRGQPAFRRHRQGDAVLEGRGRHGALPGRQQPDARRRARPRRELAFPESVVEFFQGRLGQPPGGFPAELQEQGAQGPARAHRAARAPTCRRPISTRRARRLRPCSAATRPMRDALSYLLYPRVFPDLAAHERTYSDTSILPTSIFFFGPDPGEEHQGRDRGGQDPDRQAAGRGRASRRRHAHGLLRAERPAARGRSRSTARWPRRCAKLPRPIPPTPTRSARRCRA